jgi:hypothetical protein
MPAGAKLQIGVVLHSGISTDILKLLSKKSDILKLTMIGVQY